MRKPAAVVSRLPISQARVSLGQVAKRAQGGGEYFILEKDGVPVLGIMGADELEDYLELRNPKVRRQIESSNADINAGRVQPAGTLLRAVAKKSKSR